MKLNIKLWFLLGTILLMVALQIQAYQVHLTDLEEDRRSAADYSVNKLPLKPAFVSRLRRGLYQQHHSNPWNRPTSKGMRP